MALKILVVDDATFIRDLVKRTLRHHFSSVEMLEAADGERGMALVKQQKPDIILSDWEMPKLSGTEFVSWLRQHPDLGTIPFIMITSRGDRGHVMEAVQAGVSDYISKPFSAEELTRKVMKQLKKLGYSDKIQKVGATTQSSGNASVDALTGAGKTASGSTTSNQTLSGKATQKKSAAQGANVASNPLLQRGSASKPPPAKKSVTRPAGALANPPPVPQANQKGAAKQGPSSSKAGGFKGKAQLRFADGKVDSDIRDLSLQAANLVMSRAEKIPALFEQAAIDLEDADGEVLARLNAYVHSVQAMTPHPDSESLKVVVRFVDKDPEKMEVLSKAIAKS